MADSTPDLDAWIDALAPVVGIAVTDEYRPGVRANLAVALRMAEIIEAVELDDHDEPAPVFTA